MMKPGRTIPAPASTPETLEYWETAKQGKLLIRRCLSCGEAHHYPRTICPFCFSDNTEWQVSSGEAVIYSYSVMRRANPPYVIAYVTLKEGPTMMTNIVNCDFDKLHIGQKVKLVSTLNQADIVVPLFVPE